MHGAFLDLMQVLIWAIIVIAFLAVLVSTPASRQRSREMRRQAQADWYRKHGAQPPRRYR